MKIKYFQYGLWPSNSPSTIFVTYNTLGFKKNNFNFQFITTKNSIKSKEDILKTQFGIDSDIPIHTINAWIFKRNHLIVGIFALFYLLFKEFDILITRNLSFMPFALLLRKIKGVKVIFESHDFFTDLSLRSEIKEKPRKKQSKQEKRFIPKVDAVICVSEEQKLLYRKYYSSQIFFTAVSGIKSFKKNSPKQNFTYTLGYIGTFSEKIYNIEILIDAVSKLENKKIKLILAGANSDSELNKINRIVDKFNIRERVRVLRWMKPKEVESLKKEIDLGCCPLMPYFRNRISSPLKVLEYFSSGIPVISTNLHTPDFIVKDGINGYLVENKVAHWVKAIDSVYTDFEDYYTLSLNCFKTAEKYSWDARARRIHNFLDEEFGD